MTMIDKYGHWRKTPPLKKKFKDMTMSEQMIQLRSEAAEDHKEYIVVDSNDEQFGPQMEDFNAPGNMTAVMGGNLSGKSAMGAEAARTLKMLSLTARVNRDNSKVDPDYLYELINQLKTQLNREKPNRKKANRIFNKLRAEVADNVSLFQDTRERLDEITRVNELDSERLQKEIKENTSNRHKILDYKHEMEKLQADKAELQRKLACFEEDGEVAKIRSRLIKVVRNQA